MNSDTEKKRKRKSTGIINGIRLLVTLMPFIGLIIGYGIYYIGNPTTFSLTSISSSTPTSTATSTPTNTTPIPNTGKIVICPKIIDKLEYTVWETKTKIFDKPIEYFEEFNNWLNIESADFSKGDELQEGVLILVQNKETTTQDMSILPIRLILDTGEVRLYKTQQSFRSLFPGRCIATATP